MEFNRTRNEERTRQLREEVARLTEWGVQVNNLGVLVHQYPPRNHKSRDSPSFHYTIPSLPPPPLPAHTHLRYNLGKQNEDAISGWIIVKMWK